MAPKRTYNKKGGSDKGRKKAKIENNDDENGDTRPNQDSENEKNEISKKDEHLFLFLLLPDCSSRKLELQTILRLLRTSDEAKSKFKKKCSRRGDFSTTSNDTIQSRKQAISTVVSFQ